MKLARDRVYLTTLVLTLIAITATGLFLYRDFSSPSLQKVSLAQGRTGGTAATGATGGTAATSHTVTTGGSSGSSGSAGSPGSSVSAGGGPGGGSVAASAGRSPACVNGTITVGQIVPITGPVSEKTAQEATQSYFNMVNGQGGINGCSVKLITLDDGGLNQQQAAADARQLVEQDHCFAIVGNVEPETGDTTAPYFAQAGIPVVGVDGVGVQEYNNPVEYSFAESPQGFGISTEDYLHALGFRRPAIFYLNFDFGQASFQAFQAEAKKNGDTVVYSNAENVSSTSYPTDVLAAKAANPDVVVNIMDANSVVREINAMESNSWYPNMVATTSTSDPVVNSSEQAWLDNPSHTVYVQRNYYPANYPSPQVQQWVTTEGHYYPGFDANSYAEGAWLGAQIFTQLARQLGPKLTQQTLLQALNSMHNFQTGFEPPITMTPDHGPNHQVLWEVWSASSHSYVQKTGFQPW